MQSHVDVFRHLATQTAPKSARDVIGLSLSKEQGLQSGLAEFEGNAPRILSELAGEVAKACKSVSTIVSEQSSRVEELTRVIGSAQRKIAITQLHTSSSIGNMFREKISCVDAHHLLCFLCSTYPNLALYPHLAQVLA
jgi:hypothetical protein